MTTYVEFENKDDVFSVELFDHQTKSLDCTISRKGEARLRGDEAACVRIYLPGGADITVPVTGMFVSVTDQMLSQSEGYGERLFVGATRRPRYRRGRHMKPAQPGMTRLKDGTEVQLTTSIGQPVVAYVDLEREQVNYLADTSEMHSYLLTMRRDSVVARVQVPGNFRSIAVVLGEVRVGEAAELLVSVKTDSPESEALLGYLSHGDFAAARGFREWSTLSGEPWHDLVRYLFKLTTKSIPLQADLGLSESDAVDHLQLSVEGDEYLLSAATRSTDKEEADLIRGYQIFTRRGFPIDANVMTMWMERNALGEPLSEAERIGDLVDKAPVYGVLSELYVRMLREAQGDSQLKGLYSDWTRRMGFLIQGHALTTSVNFLPYHAGPTNGMPLLTTFDQTLPLSEKAENAAEELKYHSA